MKAVLLASCGLFAACVVVRGDQPPAGDWRALPPDRVSAPVYYEDTMLILTTARGTAAVVFPKPVQELDRQGVAFRYRFRPKGGGKEQAGDGELFERPRDPKNPNDFLAWRTVVRAGPVDQVLWSNSTSQKGWVYYVPEEVRVQVAKARGWQRVAGPRRVEVDHLETIDLSRFEK